MTTTNRAQSVNPAAAIEKAFFDLLAWFGDLASFCWKVIRAMFTPPFELREFLRQFDSIGAKSLPLVALAGAATGRDPGHSAGHRGYMVVFPRCAFYDIFSSVSFVPSR